MSRRRLVLVGVTGEPVSQKASSQAFIPPISGGSSSSASKPASLQPDGTQVCVSAPTPSRKRLALEAPTLRECSLGGRRALLTSAASRTPSPKRRQVIAEQVTPLRPSQSRAPLILRSPAKLKKYPGERRRSVEQCKGLHSGPSDQLKKALAAILAQREAPLQRPCPSHAPDITASRARAGVRGEQPMNGCGRDLVRSEPPINGCGRALARTGAADGVGHVDDLEWQCA